jgi:hypothetical protein
MSRWRRDENLALSRIPRIKYNPIPVDAASCKAYPRTCWLAKTVWHDRGFQCTHCLAVAEDAKAIHHRET